MVQTQKAIYTVNGDVIDATILNTGTQEDIATEIANLKAHLEKYIKITEQFIFEQEAYIRDANTLRRALEVYEDNDLPF